MRRVLTPPESDALTSMFGPPRPAGRPQAKVSDSEEEDSGIAKPKPKTKSKEVRFRMLTSVSQCIGADTLNGSTEAKDSYSAEA